MDKLKYKARAKVNLGLDVCGRLPNGYHKVKMIMQTIDLYDELEFNKRKDPDIILSVDSKDPLGDIGNNLIFRAAKLMKEYYSIKEGIEIHLKKHIPVAAGMAGGSTDAAATMLAMNELFELGQTREQLMEQALRLGADRNSTGRRNRGEAYRTASTAQGIYSGCQTSYYGINQRGVPEPKGR